MPALVVYYSLSGKTKACAEELAKLLGAGLFELVEEKPRKAPFGIARGVFEVFRKKETAAKLPDLNGADDLFVCTPIWAGGMSPAARYFMNRADKQGFGGTVSVLTTSADGVKAASYAEGVLGEFAAAGWKSGGAYGFCSAGSTDREILREHMEQMILGK